MIIRTSITDPIQIASIKLQQGEVGLTFCPGKRHHSAVGMGVWHRDLDVDLQAIASTGWQHLVTLVEPFELNFLSVPELGQRAKHFGLNWVHFPIVDGDQPRRGFTGLRKKLSSYLDNNQRVVVHCRGGLGRAGTLAATLLIDSGEYTPTQAIHKVRQVRPGAIETLIQEQFIESLVPL